MAGNSDWIYFTHKPEIWTELAEKACERACPYSKFSVGCLSSEAWDWKCLKLTCLHVSWLMLEISWDLSWDCHHRTTCGLFMWLGLPHNMGLGSKGKDNVLWVGEKRRPASTPSPMLRPPELEHTKRKNPLEAGHSKPNNPESMHWLDIKKLHMCSLQQASCNDSPGFIGHIALSLDKFSEIL